MIVSVVCESAAMESLPQCTKKGWYTRLMRECGSLLPVLDAKSLAIVFVDEKKIKTLDAYYQKRPRVTDVLSFWYPEDREGEIFICASQAMRQADRRHIVQSQEIARLFFHGYLHLVGYDHLTTRDRAIMMPLNDRCVELCVKKGIC